MSNYQEKIVNVVTNEIIFRNFTEEEIAKIEEKQAQIAAAIAADQVREVERQALLDKLGITADEAKLLLG
jgi:hypothetical protein